MKDVMEYIYEIKKKFNKNITTKDLIMVSDTLYAMYDDACTNTTGLEQTKICKEITKDILPKLYKYTNKYNTTELYECWLKFFALSARGDFKQYLYYYGIRNQVELYINAGDLFDGFIEYANILVNSNEISFIVFSMPPSCGKSFILDLFSSWCYGRNLNFSNIRLSYSESNVFGASGNIRSIMRKASFSEVFTAYAGLGENEIFDPEAKEQWTVSIATNVPYSFFCAPRKGQVTGKRGELIIIDDITKGTEEAQNSDLKDKQFNWFINDVLTRKHAGAKPKAILAGTVWSDDDLLERVRGLVKSFEQTNFFGTEIGDIIIDNKFIGKIVSIKIRAEDEDTGKNNIEYAIDTPTLTLQKSTMSVYSWQALYQQDPIAQTGMPFSYNTLQKYTELPLGEDEQGVFAAIDPQRKGKNYLSMPITYKINGKFYLVDCLFRKSQMKDLYDLIVEKIIFHNIGNLLIENNTDTSLKALIEMKLTERGFFGCTMTEKFSTKNKESRILSKEVDIKNFMMFPNELPSEISELGNALRQLNKYSTEKPAKYDDFPDSIALLMDAYCSGNKQFGRVKAVKNPFR